jgi:hypothetical protein
MAEEKSKLVEQSEETVQEQSQEQNVEDGDKFNPLAFTQDVIEQSDEENKNTETDEKIETENTTSNESDNETNDSDFKWEEVKTETDEDSKEVSEPEDNWDESNSKTGVSKDEKETSGQDTELDWRKIGEELGMNVSSKEEVVDYLNKNKPIDNSTSDEIQKINEFLRLDDRSLLKEEMKVDGMGVDDIDDALDKMEDSGVMKREAFRIRKQLKNHIENQKKTSSEKQQQSKEQKAVQVAQNKKQLQDHLKDLKAFMGGSVSKDQAKKAYRYITSGEMSQDIWKSHANAAEVAMFLLFKDKFQNILMNQGLNAGKASVLNKITSPNLHQSSGSKKYKVKDGGFDVNTFMKE